MKKKKLEKKLKAAKKEIEGLKLTLEMYGHYHSDDWKEAFAFQQEQEENLEIDSVIHKAEKLLQDAK